MKKFAIILLVGLLQIACQESPTSVGSDILNNSDLLNVKSINSFDENFIQHSSIFRKKISLGSSSRVLLGKYDGSTATTLIKFNFVLPDSVSLAIQNNKLSITKTWIEFPITYKIGELTSLDFSAKKILGGWTSSGFNEDSLNILNIDNQNLISGGINKTDSLIRFDVENSFANEWMKNQVNNNSGLNKGLIFQPLAGSNAIVGITALYTLVTKDQLPKVISVVNYDGKTDTVYAYSSADLHVVSNSSIDFAQNNLVLQAGLGLRGKLSFDLSTINENSIINAAKLILYRDSISTQIGSISADSIFVNAFYDSTKDSVYTNLDSRLLVRKGNTYEGAITDIVQYWLSGDNKNQGLQLRIVGEDSNINKVVLRGSKYHDAAFRPRLIIFYSNLDN